MRSDGERQLILEDSSYRELRLLEEVNSRPDLSQRQLASRLGIGLGVANSLVRHLVDKGHIKVAQDGWRKWVYTVTPEGMARKATLTLAYIDRFLHHYRRVKRSLCEELVQLTVGVESSVAIYGSEELAELVYLALKDAGFEDIEVFGPVANDPGFLGISMKELGQMHPSDYAEVVVAAAEDVEARCQELRAIGVAPSQIVTLVQDSRYELTLASGREATH